MKNLNSFGSISREVEYRTAKASKLVVDTSPETGNILISIYEFPLQNNFRIEKDFSSILEYLYYKEAEKQVKKQNWFDKLKSLFK